MLEYNALCCEDVSNAYPRTLHSELYCPRILPLNYPNDIVRSHGHVVELVNHFEVSVPNPVMRSVYCFSDLGI
jgi:hypothetical protein